MTHPQYSADIEDVADIIRDKVYADENDKVGGVYDAAQKVIEYITALAAQPPAAPVETEVSIIVERLLKLAACEDELSHDCDMRPEDTANAISAQWLREAASFIQTAQAAQRSSAAPVEPYAWVIPGDDQSRPSGSIDAMAWREGEFTKPLYAQMPAAGMSRDDAESLVFDLLDAARSFDQAETAFRRGAREYYDEMRDRVISAISGIERPQQGAP